MELLLVVLCLVLVNLLASRHKSYPEWERRFQEESDDWMLDSSDARSPLYDRNPFATTSALDTDFGMINPDTASPISDDYMTGFDIGNSAFDTDWPSQDGSMFDDIGSGFSDHDSYGSSGSAFDD